MALYAIEVQTGQRPGPYTDTDAERYARHAIALRQARVPRLRRGAHARTAAPRTAHGTWGAVWNPKVALKHPYATTPSGPSGGCGAEASGSRSGPPGAGEVGIGAGPLSSRNVRGLHSSRRQRSEFDIASAVFTSLLPTPDPGCTRSL